MVPEGVMYLAFLAACFITASEGQLTIFSNRRPILCSGQTLVLHCFDSDTDTSSALWQANVSSGATWPPENDLRIQQTTDFRRNLAFPDPHAAVRPLIVHHLTVANVSKADAGDYKCTANGIVILWTRVQVVDCPLEVLVTLTVQGETKSKRVPEEDYFERAIIVFPQENKTTAEVTLSCSVVSAGSDEPLATKSETFKNISHYDVDVYAECAVEYKGNWYRSQAEFKEMTETTEPREQTVLVRSISTWPSKVLACAGSTQSLYCGVFNIPITDITHIGWSPNEASRMQQKTHNWRNIGWRGYLETKGEFVIYHELKIKDVSKADEGTYWCSANTANGTLKTYAVLKVIDCPLEVLVTLAYDGKTKSIRLPADRFCKDYADIAFPNEVKTSGEVKMTCSVVDSGSDIPLASSTETYTDISTYDGVVQAYCRVTYRTEEYYSAAEFH